MVIGAGGASHEAGMAALWTGTATSNGNNAPSGPSIDQAIAPQLQAQGVRTAYPTIPLMALASCAVDQNACAALHSFQDQRPNAGIFRKKLFQRRSVAKGDFDAVRQKGKGRLKQWRIRDGK